MTTLFRCTLSLSVLALALSALVGDNRYGAPHNGNSLHHRGGGAYNSNIRSPHSFSAPRAPARPAPVAYGGARNNFPSAPAHYNAPAAPAHYNAPAVPAHFSAPAAPAPYGGHSSYGAPAHVSGPSHYGSNKRSVYQQPQQPARHGLNNNSNYPQQHSSFSQTAESKSQTHGREMKYTINDPQNRGQTHVTETHIVSNKQMHGAEAEAAMKKLMGSMGPGPSYGSDGGFQDFVKGMGLPSFY